MSMGKRTRDRQPAMWVPTTDLPTAASHPFYRRLNQLLREHGFDDFVEGQRAGFYAETRGRPSLPPGIYFRLLLIGYVEGIDSERGIAWRAADSLVLRDFLGLALTNAPSDHSTISRTRRLIALETHWAVFTWVLQCLGGAGLIKGKTIGLDATTLEATAALRSFVRRDTYRGNPTNYKGAVSYASGRAGSVTIGSGVWELCQGANFSGRCVTLDRSVPDLGAYGMRNRVGSVRPVSPQAR